MQGLQSTKPRIYLLLKEEFNISLGLYQLAMGAGENLVLDQEEQYLTDGWLDYFYESKWCEYLSFSDINCNYFTFVDPTESIIE